MPTRLELAAAMVSRRAGITSAVCVAAIAMPMLIGCR